MGLLHLVKKTNGEAFYDITKEIQSGIKDLLSNHTKKKNSGVLHLFLKHTSCALTISEAFDPSAARDMENFLKHLSPRDLAFIEHTTEGPDDSPSHMKSILLQPSLTLFIEDRELILGQWQGIYLCEFRDAPKTRNILLKFIPDA